MFIQSKNIPEIARTQQLPGKELRAARLIASQMFMVSLLTQKGFPARCDIHPFSCPQCIAVTCQGELGTCQDIRRMPGYQGATVSKGATGIKAAEARVQHTHLGYTALQKWTAAVTHSNSRVSCAGGGKSCLVQQAASEVPEGVVCVAAGQFFQYPAMHSKILQQSQMCMANF